MSTHKTPEPEKHETHRKHKAPDGFVRVGNRVINLAHVVAVDLAVDGDAKQPLTVYSAGLPALQVTGDDAAAVAALMGG